MTLAVSSDLPRRRLLFCLALVALTACVHRDEPKARPIAVLVPSSAPVDADSSAAPDTNTDAGTEAVVLPAHLSAPPSPTGNPSAVYSADAGDFRPPAGVALLEVRNPGGGIDVHVAPPRAVRACLRGKPPVTVRIRVEPARQGSDAGPRSEIVEQEGVDAPAAACILHALEGDAVWKDALDRRRQPVLFDLIVR